MHTGTGSITPYIDVAQLTLYAFWLFFLGLVIYLILENKREGFPLITKRPGERLDGILWMPRPKTFLFRTGKTRTVPEIEPDEVINAAQMEGNEGAPYFPLGDPMQDGIGPASYCMRIDEPELTYDLHHRTVPMRIMPENYIAEEDPDPRGFDVITVDRLLAGVVTDVWFDRGAMLPRYLEVGTPSGRTVLVPAELVKIQPWERGGGAVKVISVTAAQLAAAPAPRQPDLITAREEDRIQAYFASGHMYAIPGRIGPVL